MEQYKDPTLYKKAKAKADKLYDKPSAYKSGFIVQEYKRLGGRFNTKRKGKQLNKAIKVVNKNK